MQLRDATVRTFRNWWFIQGLAINFFRLQKCSLAKDRSSSVQVPRNWKHTISESTSCCDLFGFAVDSTVGVVYRLKFGPLCRNDFSNKLSTRQYLLLLLLLLPSAVRMLIIHWDSQFKQFAISPHIWWRLYDRVQMWVISWSSKSHFLRSKSESS